MTTQDSNGSGTGSGQDACLTFRIAPLLTRAFVLGRFLLSRLPRKAATEMRERLEGAALRGMWVARSTPCVFVCSEKMASVLVVAPILYMMMNSSDKDHSV